MCIEVCITRRRHPRPPALLVFKNNNNNLVDVLYYYYYYYYYYMVEKHYFVPARCLANASVCQIGSMNVFSENQLRRAWTVDNVEDDIVACE